MNIGSCAACKSKDSEIEFLRGEVVALRERLTNMVDPLLQARLAAASRTEPPKPRDTPPPIPRSPQMIRATRSDRPPQEPKPGSEADLDKAAKLLEGSFNRQP